MPSRSLRGDGQVERSRRFHVTDEGRLRRRRCPNDGTVLADAQASSSQRLSCSGWTRKTSLRSLGASS